ncbi:hypothetical protein J7F01_17755 [Streptomyces sp. ISL-22]|uniref:Type A2 lantipeptide n=1 Tax=Streptomyces curacoi TaxID=146536 RepID=A0A124H766_9ACTN|nr:MULTISPECIES: hypothetical protein [Streptomyces]KUM81106.1 hypothetical protein AQI70_03695 [Streptomyces curacoi]MBT2420118.1 hypothetical protein [Streptomyces sp. ISL-24]MBT2433992.1 hypothetical protein [Streptomyces sp. ISL-22]
MSFTSQVETAEIADAVLDNISGGQAGGASAGLAGTLSGGVAGLSESVTAVACADVFAAVSPEGVALGVHTHAAAH